MPVKKDRTRKDADSIQVNIQLDGDIARRFKRFMAKDNIRTRAGAGYKLLKIALDKLLPR